MRAIKTNKKLEKELSRREDKAAATIARKAEDTIRRHYYGIVDPKGYYKRCISLRILGILPTVIDNCLTDVETIGGIPYRDSKMLKLQREVSVAVDRLLKHVQNDHIDTYRYLGEDLETAKQSAICFGDVSNFVNEMLEIVCGFCTDKNEEWRLVKLMEVAENLLTDDAVDDKADQVRRYCLERLKAWHVDGVEEAVAKGIKPADLRLSVCGQDADTVLANEAKRSLRSFIPTKS